jgi:hypothetical protein
MLAKTKKFKTPATKITKEKGKRNLTSFQKIGYYSWERGGAAGVATARSALGRHGGGARGSWAARWRGEATR